MENRYLRYEHLKCEMAAERVLKVTLNRPERLNATNELLHQELVRIWLDVEEDDNVSAVILTGAGRAFSAGGDLRSEAAPLGALDNEHDFGDFGPYKELANYFFNDLRHVVIQRAIRKLEELEAVTIAAINGPAVGIGLELATACDMRYASERARLGEVARAGARARQKVTHANGECRGAREIVGERPGALIHGAEVEMILEVAAHGAQIRNRSHPKFAKQAGIAHSGQHQKLRRVYCARCQHDLAPGQHLSFAIGAGNRDAARTVSLEENLGDVRSQ